MTDLDALDQLYQATTPGPRKLYHGGNEWEVRALDPEFGEEDSVAVARFHIVDGLPDENAKSYVALHNAWPAIKRELEAGRLCRAALQSAKDVVVGEHWMARCNETLDNPECTACQCEQALAAYDAAHE